MYAAGGRILIPGWDATGVVDEADPATGCLPGDKFLAIQAPVVDGGGTYAEKVVVASEAVARIPAAMISLLAHYSSLLLSRCSED